MARLVQEAIEIYSDSDYTTLIGRIEGVRFDDITRDKEGNAVTIENGREIDESYSGTVEARSTKTDFASSAGGSADGTAILASDHVSNDGSEPTESYVKMVGKSNSKDIDWGACYVNGMEKYDNGRIETMIKFTLTEVAESDVATSSAPTGS